ncbi:MAG: hypothetical protein ACLTIF_03055 [Lachnospiraceae bacterium]
MNCRSGKDSTDYDFVVGGVANDRVFIPWSCSLTVD